MKYEFNFRQVQYWLLGVMCLGLLSAQAESMYQKSPRLAPRNRQTVPAPSPLLPVAQPERPVDSRIHAEPPPPLSPGYETVKESQAEATPSPQAKPAKSAKQQKTAIQAAPQGHPLVAAPAGQGWDEPVASKQTAPPTVTVKPAPQKTVAHKPMRGKVEVTLQPVKKSPVATPAAATVAKTNEHEKPLVHFPEDLRTSARSAGKKGLERGFYPVGYRPYLPATLTGKAKEYEMALLHYNRGSFYGHTNQLAEAVREYQEAIRQNPALADAYVGLSSVYLFQSNWEDVILNANKALSLRAGFIDPVNITQARYNLSTAYCAAADYGKAKRFYKMVKSASHPKTEQLGQYLERNCKP